MIDLHFENNNTNNWVGIVIPGWDKDSNQQMIVILKTAFHFNTDGVLRPITPAPAILYHGEYHDMVPFKPTPEIILSGFGTGVKNNPINISLTYHNKKHWQKNTSLKKLSIQQQSLARKKPKYPPDSFNFAPHDQYLPAPIKGGEKLSIGGARTPALNAILPALKPQITFHTPSAKTLLSDPICDTLLVDLQRQSLTFTFRTAMLRTHRDISPGLLTVSLPHP